MDILIFFSKCIHHLLGIIFFNLKELKNQRSFEFLMKLSNQYPIVWRILRVFARIPNVEVLESIVGLVLAALDKPLMLIGRVRRNKVNYQMHVFNIENKTSIN